MTIMTFDDGSTIDTDTGGSATQSPPGYLISDYGSNFSPSGLTPGASSFADVLKYGFGRIVDYKTASLNSQNTPPTYAAQNLAVTPGTIGGMSGGTLLLIGAAVLAAVLLTGKD